MGKREDIVVIIEVDGIRAEVEDIINQYDIKIVDNEAGNFIGSDELSIMADAFTILQVLDLIYRRYGDDIEVAIRMATNNLHMKIMQLMTYITSNFHVFPQKQGRIHCLMSEQCRQIVDEDGINDDCLSLEVDNELAFPKIDGNKIYYGKSCELVTILFVLYHSNNIDVKKLLLLYILLELNISKGNSSNVYFLLKKVDKEIVRFYRKCHKIEEDIYTDALACFQLKHEVYHLKIKRNPSLLNDIIEEIQVLSVAYDVNVIGNGVRQRLVRDGVKEILKSKDRQIELACDWYSTIETIKFMLSSDYQIDSIQSAIKQILRMLAMTQYVKHMSFIPKFSISMFKRPINNQVFDTLRVANILNAMLHSSLSDSFDANIVDAFVSEMQKYGKDTLNATLRLGLCDLRMLATASVESIGLAKNDILPELLTLYTQQRDLLRAIISTRWLN